MVRRFTAVAIACFISTIACAQEIRETPVADASDVQTMYRYAKEYGQHTYGRHWEIDFDTPFPSRCGTINVRALENPSADKSTQLQVSSNCRAAYDSGELDVLAMFGFIVDTETGEIVIIDSPLIEHKSGGKSELDANALRSTLADALRLAVILKKCQWFTNLCR